MSGGAVSILVSSSRAVKPPLPAGDACRLTRASRAGILIGHNARPGGLVRPHRRMVFVLLVLSSLLLAACAPATAAAPQLLRLAATPRTHHSRPLHALPPAPAGLAPAASAAEALQRIYDSQSTFVSRGDDSGTNVKELALWEAAGLTPGPTEAWYQSIGQGMGETLQFAHEEQGYTLADRGTYLSLADSLADLLVQFGGAPRPRKPRRRRSPPRTE